MSATPRLKPLVGKAELRTQIRKKLADMSLDDIQRRSTHTCDLLIAQSEYQNAEIIMVFLSLANEINTASLVLKAWQDRKRILAPQVSWEQRRMIPVEIRSLSDQDIEETQWGIRQPTQGVPIPIDMIDLVIVPGLGFDLNGVRLGRGRGFYDRFLANPTFHASTCGLAFEEQVVNSLPVDAHDIRVQMLVTDRHVHRFA